MFFSFIQWCLSVYATSPDSNHIVGSLVEMPSGNYSILTTIWQYELILPILLITYRAPLANLGLWNYREKLELWDYTLFEIGITEIGLEIGIMDLKFNKFIFSIPSKLGLWDFTLCEIGITPVLKLGLRYYRTPPVGALLMSDCSCLDYI